MTRVIRRMVMFTKSKQFHGQLGFYIELQFLVERRRRRFSLKGILRSEFDHQ